MLKREDLLSKLPGMLHYLFSKSDGKVIAHCLDFDLVVSADSDEKAQARLNHLVVAHLKTAFAHESVQAISIKAPQNYWEEFSKAEFRGMTEISLVLPLPTQREPRTSERPVGKWWMLEGSATPAGYGTLAGATA